MKQMRCKKVVYNLLVENWVNILLAMLTLLVASLLSLVSPIIYKELIDEVVPSKDLESLVVYLIIMIVIPWLITLIVSLKNLISTKIGESISNSLRLLCFERALHAKQASLENITPPQILNRITRECGRIGEIYITKDLVTFVSELITLVATLITMIVFNAPLTCVCVIAFPISFFLTKYVSKRNKKLDSELFSCLDNGNSFLNEALNRIKMIKLKNAYCIEMDKLQKWMNSYQKIRMKTAVTHSINSFLLGDLIINVIYGVIFFVSGVLVIYGKMTIGTLVSFVAFVPKVYSSLRNVLNIKISTDVIDNAFKSIDEILDLPQENVSGLQVEEIEVVSFKDVCFHYGRDNFRIEHMNLDIKKGQIIGIVGKSGGGKTTIFDLLTGLYYPQEGEVRINEEDILCVDVDSLRRRISVVTQDVELFEGSIMDNIMFNCSESSSKLEDFLEVVSLKEFIEQLPEGLETNIGYDGGLISGGQRQRIAIVNALMKESDVLLLDEFTSALDIETERKVMDYIFSLKDKIVIIVSHRIYTLMKCDEIYIISDGKIVEHGTPAELGDNQASYFTRLLNDLSYS